MIRKKSWCVCTVITLALLSMEFQCNPDSYARAGKLAKDFAASVLVAQQVEQSAHKAGFIDDATNISIQNELDQIATAGIRLDAAINQTHDASGATAAVKVIVGLLQDLSQNKLAGIKNENTRISLAAALLVAQTTIDNIAAFGGAH